jgi:zinc-binding oxidoreductase
MSGSAHQQEGIVNHIIRYRSFGSPDVLEEADVPLSEPQGADVRVRVHAVGLNPVDYKTFNGDLRALEHLRQLAHPLRRTPMFPRGVGRDFSGVITAVGPTATGRSVGDPVLGTLRSAPGQIVPQGALATEVIAPAETITAKPEGMSYQTAASLGVAAETACGAFRRLRLAADDVIVIIAAAGGVGSLASQLALAMGATVVGIAGRGNADYLRSLGVIPVVYGQDLATRIAQASPQPVTKLLDCYGKGYARLGADLRIPRSGRGTLVPSPGALAQGARFTGARHALPGDLERVAQLVASGRITIHVANEYPMTLEGVRAAYTELAAGHTRGKIVVTDDTAR